MKAPGDLLIGISGGLGSTVLLDLVSKVYFSPERLVGPERKSRGTDHPRNASVWNKAAVCYIEICNAFPEVCSQVSIDGYFFN
jgi:cytoplasmic tRNA 2-thiolation protein 2